VGQNSSDFRRLSLTPCFTGVPTAGAAGTETVSIFLIAAAQTLYIEGTDVWMHGAPAMPQPKNE
jgi:hypothetical protein